MEPTCRLLGNPILGDDGVGWRVVEAAEAQLNGAEIDAAYLSLGGRFELDGAVDRLRAGDQFVDLIQTEGSGWRCISKFDLN